MYFKSKYLNIYIKNDINLFTFMNYIKSNIYLNYLIIY